MRDRILEINPDAKVNVHKCFFLPENAEEFPFEGNMTTLLMPLTQ